MINDHISTATTVTENSQVSEARRAVRDIGVRCGFSDEDIARACIVATEAATNLVKHTSHGGSIVASVVQEGAHFTLQILSIDRGPGMDLSRCMTDGFSSSSSPGTGLGAMRRQSDEFDMFSMASGTVILSLIRPRSHPVIKHAFAVGGISVPVVGEFVCGDSWDVYQSPDRLVAIIADGLGHGIQAHEASVEAMRVFNITPLPRPAELLDNVHRAMMKTRGGAVAIADLNTRVGKVTYCGMGNIAGVISAEHQRSMVSMNGTVGMGTARTKEFDYPWTDDATLIMHSDGLHSHWDLEAYPGLRSRHPAIIAGVLYRDSVRGKDDATVLVAKRV